MFVNYKKYITLKNNYDNIDVMLLYYRFVIYNIYR